MMCTEAHRSYAGMVAAPEVQKPSFCFCGDAIDIPLHTAKSEQPHATMTKIRPRHLAIGPEDAIVATVSISGSVGKDAKNSPSDVTTIKNLLNIQTCAGLTVD